MEELILADVTFGTVQIVPTYRVAGEYMYFGGFSIHRDRNGVEVSRTTPTEHFRVYFPPEPKKTLWQKLKEWM